MKNFIKLVFSLGLIAAMVAGYFLFLRPNRGGSNRVMSERQKMILAFLGNPAGHAAWMLPAGTVCSGAPFQMPTDGYIGFVWDDSFSPNHHHTGLDIFGGDKSGRTPVYAAYDGYLTRESGWKSTLIIRIPSDPLQPGRQIWTYYTHMADRLGNDTIAEDFPPGTEEVFVEAGTLLGYQGNYSGDPLNPVGVHLHFSIVADDGSGKFMDERLIENTLDPSPYFGMALNFDENPSEVPLCPVQAGVLP
ncbi:MAG: M23 family metallopeptidase [Anaerolineaceae bacterium]